MLTTTFSDFRKDTKGYLDKVTKSFETLIMNTISLLIRSRVESSTVSLCNTLSLQV